MRRLAAILAVLTLAATASAATYNVTTADDWQSTVQSLDNAGHTVNFADGLYSVTNTMLLPSNVVIAATSKAAILTGGGTCQVVRSVGASNWVVGFSIRDGYATNFGGGLSGRDLSSYLSVSNCAISNCTSYAPGGSGGGAWAVNLYDSTVDTCYATNGVVAYGGGIRAANVYRSTIRNCRSSAYGGGISSSSMWDSNVISNYCLYGGGGAYKTFASNGIISSNLVSASGYGGGGNLLYGYGFTVEYNRCLASGNGTGGGVYSAGAASESGLSNCIIRFNHAAHASGAGGGVAGTSIRLYNCVIASNTAGAGMAGIRDGTAYYCDIYGNVVTNASPAGGGGGAAGFADLYGCVIASNSSPVYSAVSMAKTILNCTIVGHTNAAPLVQYTNKYVFANNIVWGNVSNDVYNTTNVATCSTNDPLFIAGGAWKITAAGGCKDTGTSALVPVLLTTDFYGRPRKNGTVDIGAVEWTTGDETAAAAERRRALQLLMGIL